MAKLYWRVKKDGKWTWKPADVNTENPQGIWVVVRDYVEESQ